LILRNQLITLLRYYDITNGGKTREEILRTANDADNDWKYLLPEEAFAVSLSSKVLNVSEVDELLKLVSDTAVIDLRPYMNR